MEINNWYINPFVNSQWCANHQLYITHERTRLTYLCGLFIIDLSLRSILLKPTTGLRISWALNTVRWHWSVDTHSDSCQLTITWMSIRMCTINLDTDCIYLGHLASNDRSLQENSQSENPYYCSHIINKQKMSDWIPWKKKKHILDK